MGRDVQVAMRSSAAVLLTFLLAVAACGGGNGSSPGDGGDMDVNPGDSTVPRDGPADAPSDAPPVLGAQIDRAGRAGINTLLDHAFDTNGATRGAATDAYNADGVQAHWSTYVPALAASLAVYDGLDGTCGNQMLYTPGTGYTPLATLLADDRLYVDTRLPACAQYFALERGAPDCGGRTPAENVVDDTYAILAGGTGLTNGIAAPASPPTAAFPYLAAPH
jgi:hypothetical protein